MEQCRSWIDIVNFKDNEIVNYSLILIKGIVRTDSYAPSEHLEVDSICNGNSNKWPIIQCNFRSLILLKEGSNNLSFRFRSFTRTISIVFSKRQSAFCVFPTFIVFKNGENDDVGEFQGEEYSTVCARISFCAKLLQGFYAEKLYENGFGHRTFQLIEDITDQYGGCHLFRSKIYLEEAKSLSPECLWETLGREIMKSEVGNVKFKYLAVAYLLPDNYRNGKTFQIALGSGGLALIDSLPVCTWPHSVDQVLTCFTDTTKLDPPLSTNVWYKGTKGGCCSASIGSICHELGHTFDLGHPSSGIMSTDFHLFHSAFLPVLIDHKNQTTTFDLQFIPDITTILSKNGTNCTKLKKASPIKNLKKIIDESSFTPGCMTILSHHKWFNDVDSLFKIYFDVDRVLLQSEAGLKVVQLRGENGKVIKSWELSGAKTEHMVLPRIYSCLSIFAMDNYGNISRFSYSDPLSS